jgi:CubicO group peptidase (beta-lactamase class C family)
MSCSVRTALLLILLLLDISCAADYIPFTPCPLLGPRFPIPKYTSESAIVREGTQNLTDALNSYVAAGDGDFGSITPNITSFSITLFSVDKPNSTDPYFYEYHHSSQTNTKVDVRVIYPVGDLTTLFTVWLFLIEAGEEYWSDPVSKWLPELASSFGSETTNLKYWDSVTLGDLAAHLGGIGRYSPDQDFLDPELAIFFQEHQNTKKYPCETRSGSCDRAQFLSYIGKRTPVFGPARTPIFSNTGFILLAYALENIKNRPFNEMLTSSILAPLNMSDSALNTAPKNSSSTSFNRSTGASNVLLEIEAPYNGLFSSVSDISVALRAMFSSQLIDPSVTNRWLKPVAHTSNRANSVGRPWEIFSLTVKGPSPVIPVHQVRGNIDLYSSHVGLVPDYNVGFVVMGTDSVKNPDFNAIVDMISVAMIPALEKNAIVQATQAFSGTYSAKSGDGQNTTVSLTIAQAIDSSPGLTLTKFTSGSQDLRTVYAQLQDIRPENLSIRLYLAYQADDTAQGSSVAFRAVFQDMSALADACTPTCETWRYVDKMQYKGVALDEFVFKTGGDEAVDVEVKALQLQLKKHLD